jgi:hypothetical protein
MIDRDAGSRQALLLSPATLQALLQFLHDRGESISTERRDR